MEHNATKLCNIDLIFKASRRTKITSLLTLTIALVINQQSSKKVIEYHCFKPTQCMFRIFTSFGADKIHYKSE